MAHIFESSIYIYIYITAKCTKCANKQTELHQPYVRGKYPAGNQNSPPHHRWLKPIQTNTA